MMGLLAKWVARGLLVLVALAVLALGVIYAGSERILRRRHAAPVDTALRLPPSRDDAEARRQAAIIGCYEGCHGKTGQGLTMVVPGIHRITAPSLTEVLPTYTDGELVRLLRYGVRRDGTTALLMPADTFYPMSDEHIGEIVNFLRRQPVVAGPPRVRQLSLKARLGILLGKYPLSVVGVDPSSPRWGAQPRTSAFERGRYTASTVCAECHAPSFEGDPIDGGPSLRIVGAYDLPAFRHLLVYRGARRRAARYRDHGAGWLGMPSRSSATTRLMTSMSSCVHARDSRRQSAAGRHRGLWARRAVQRFAAHSGARHPPRAGGTISYPRNARASSPTSVRADSRVGSSDGS